LQASLRLGSSGDYFHRSIELLELAAREALPGFRIVEYPVRKNQWDRAHLIEARDLLGRQRHFCRGKVVFKLSQRARSDDRKRALGCNPGDGNLTGRDAGVPREADIRLIRNRR
jgi:hypothetical protein